VDEVHGVGWNEFRYPSSIRIRIPLVLKRESQRESYLRDRPLVYGSTSPVVQQITNGEGKPVIDEASFRKLFQDKIMEVKR
jgi:hypothetical protein